MSLRISLPQLEEKPLHLAGELPVQTLDIDPHDELIRLAGPLAYDLEIEWLNGGVLVQGSLRLDLACECARCLKPFRHRLTLANWTCHLALEGEEAVPVVNQCVDLTPQVREDILLAFPQHPLCEPGCKGLAGPPKDPAKGGEREPGLTSSAWAELGKLKL